MTHLSTLQKYYDAPTLRAWISRYESSEGKSQKAQVSRWRRVLAELENVENCRDVSERQTQLPKR